MERVLVLIKPDGMERRLGGRIISRFEDAGLKIVGLKILKAEEAKTRKHYFKADEWLNEKGKMQREDLLKKGVKAKETDKELGLKIIDSLVKEIMRMPIIAIVFEGNAAAEVARKIAGSTEPRKADPSTIRGAYSSDSYALAASKNRAVRNLVHVSEPQDAENEIRIWFKDSEIYSYGTADEEAMYG
jgi:nucleoside-diphosphate kinase